MKKNYLTPSIDVSLLTQQSVLTVSNIALADWTNGKDFGVYDPYGDLWR